MTDVNIQSNIEELRKHIPADVKLVCVSKFHPPDMVMEAYNAGERIFGESRAQEFIAKQAVLPADIQWHFIGHLQTNKVKFIIPFADLIHGADSLKILSEINEQAAKINKIVSCLLQIHIAEEETKFGFSTEELLTLLDDGLPARLPNIRINGLMGMATNTDDENQIRKEFRKFRALYERIKTGFFADDAFFSEFSVGMSQDYRIAIEEGSTMVRIGTSIFGGRTY